MKVQKPTNIPPKHLYIINKTGTVRIT